MPRSTTTMAARVKRIRTEHTAVDERVEGVLAEVLLVRAAEAEEHDFLRLGGRERGDPQPGEQRQRDQRRPRADPHQAAVSAITRRAISVSTRSS